MLACAVTSTFATKFLNDLPRRLEVSKNESQISLNLVVALDSTTSWYILSTAGSIIRCYLVSESSVALIFCSDGRSFHGSFPIGMTSRIQPHLRFSKTSTFRLCTCNNCRCQILSYRVSMLQFLSVWHQTLEQRICVAGIIMTLPLNKVRALSEWTGCRSDRWHS